MWGWVYGVVKGVFAGIGEIVYNPKRIAIKLGREEVRREVLVAVHKARNRADLAGAARRARHRKWLRDELDTPERDS